MKKNNILISISATLITTIVSIAVTIFSLKSDSILIQIIYIILLVLLTGIVIVIYLYLAAIEFKESKEQYEKTVRDVELLPVLPQLFIFKNRKDIFTVLDNGDAKLEWIFEIEKKNNNIEFINFPVVCERKDNNISMEFVSVIVEELSINGKKQNKEVYELKSISCTRESNRAVEYGCIHIPLSHVVFDNELINVKIVLILKNIFCDFKNSEFAIVDIPYITRKLMLVIKADSNKKLIEVTNNFFKAHEIDNKNENIEEQIKQRAKCSTTNNKLLWETTYPKLSYRYEIYFRLVDKED